MSTYLADVRFGGAPSDPARSAGTVDAARVYRATLVTQPAPVLAAWQRAG